MSEEQIMLGGFGTPEEDVYEAIKPQLLDVIENNWAPADMLSLDKRATFYTISYGSSLVARIRLGDTQATSYIELPEGIVRKFEGLSDSGQAKNGMVKYLVSGKDQAIKDFANCIAESLDCIISTYPKDYDCCSRYEECSDAKHCIHPDRKFALGCHYRRVLKSGRIFYGKNRTQ